MAQRTCVSCIGLFAEIPRVHKKQDAFGVGVFQEAIGRGDGGEGFSGASRHLNEGAGAVVLERLFQLLNRFNLAIAQPLMIQRRHGLQAPPQGSALPHPFLHGRRTWKIENLT
jgi:hypothetical protein